MLQVTALSAVYGKLVCSCLSMRLERQRLTLRGFPHLSCQYEAMADSTSLSRARAPAPRHPGAAVTHIGARVRIFSALSARGCDPSSSKTIFIALTKLPRMAESQGRARHDSTGIKRARSF